jgi:hypothetical protein
VQQRFPQVLCGRKKSSIMLLGIVNCFPDSLANLCMQLLPACSKGFTNIENNPGKSVLVWGI